LLYFIYQMCYIFFFFIAFDLDALTSGDLAFYQLIAYRQQVMLVVQLKPPKLAYLGCSYGLNTQQTKPNL
jgi:hypothetical protein